MKLLRLLLLVLLLSSAYLALPAIAGHSSPASLIYAAGEEADVSPPTIEIKPVVGFASLSDAVATIVGGIFLIGAAIAFYFITMGSIKYIMSQGDPSATATARNTIRDAAIGLVILGLVFVIFRVVTAVVPGLSDFFG